MTGYATGKFELSRITIATLEDLGYQVDYSRAQSYNNLATFCSCKRIADNIFQRTYYDASFTPWTAEPDEEKRQRLQRQRRRRAQSSQEVQEKAIAYGQQYLAAMKKLKDSFPPTTVQESTQNTVFVGDQIVSVFYMDQGTVYSVLVVNPEQEQ